MTRRRQAVHKAHRIALVVELIGTYAKTECRPRVTQVRRDSVDVTHTRGEEERGEWSSHKHTDTNHTTQHQIPQPHCRGPARG